MEHRILGQALAFSSEGVTVQLSSLLPHLGLSDTSSLCHAAQVGPQ